MLEIAQFKTNPFAENAYIAYNQGDQKCIIIDPGFTLDSEFEEIKKYMAQRELSPEAILLTHSHFDHIVGVARILSFYEELKVYMSSKDWDSGIVEINKAAHSQFGFPEVDMNFRTIDIADGEVLKLAGMDIKCIATPGHSVGGFCYLIEDKLFSGDTLFAGTIGRSDLPTGEYDDLIRSVMEKLIWLDSQIEVFPGHGPATTIGYERTNNPMLEPFNEKEELD